MYGEVAQGLWIYAAQNPDSRILMAVAMIVSSVLVLTELDSCGSRDSEGWIRALCVILDRNRKEEKLAFAQGRGHEADSLGRLSDSRCYYAGCSRGCSEYPRLARKDAIRAFDNQQDCGGAQAELRHGANEHASTVGFLAAVQRGSGRHGS